jgi:hypothetical protein
MAQALPVGGTDLLTRTTLQFDGEISESAFARTIEALHRVPGVLFTETSVGITRAVVAHDGAVAVQTLVDATRGCGAQVRVIAAGLTANRVASVGLASRPNRWVSYGFLGFAVGCVIAGVIAPTSTFETHVVTPLLFVSIPVFMIVDRLARRRRS